MSTARLNRRVAELEDAVRQRDDKIAALRVELDEARALIAKIRERLEDNRANRENWIEALRLIENAEGVYPGARRVQVVPGTQRKARRSSS